MVTCLSVRGSPVPTEVATYGQRERICYATYAVIGDFNR